MLICGNWKMNQKLADVEAFFNELKGLNPKCKAWIAPQAVHITKAMELSGNIKIGAQNTNDNDSGAFTGELSPATLKDLGSDFTILGHSERRSIYNESNDLLNKKVHKALENNLEVIFCIGETLEQREAGKMFDVLGDQLVAGLANVEKKESIIVAYEPIWAIGTGKTASPEQAQEVHAFIRNLMKEKLGYATDKLEILYGGSVNTKNVNDLMGQKDINGALVGGASLKPNDFRQLVEAGDNHL